MRIEDDPPRLAVEAGQAHRQRRIVRERRLDPDHDRLVGRSHDLHARIGDRTGDLQALIVRAGGCVAVGRFRELQRHARAAFGDAANVTEMVAPRLIRPRPDRDGYSGGAEPGEPLPPDQRIGVLDRRHDPRHARLDDRVGAGRRRAEMRAGLERHIERRAARRLSGLSQRDPLRVRPPAGRGDAASDHRAVLDQNRADRRIGRGKAERSFAQIERGLHPAPVFVVHGGGRGRAHVDVGSFRRAAGGGSGRTSGSASSSPTIALKSRASRKLR